MLDGSCSDGFVVHQCQACSLDLQLILLQITAVVLVPNWSRTLPEQSWHVAAETSVLRAVRDVQCNSHAGRL